MAAAHLFVTPVIYSVTPCQGFSCRRVRPDVWPDVRRDVQLGHPAERLDIAAPLSSAAPKKKHLIEAAPFARLGQMLSTIV